MISSGRAYILLQVSQAQREKEEVRSEMEAIETEIINLGHLQQPLAWSYIVIPLETTDLDKFAWPEWVTEEEKALFMSNHLPKEGEAKQQNSWQIESERGFSAPLYRSNNKPLTDFDFKKLIQGSFSRRDRITHSTTVSFVAVKGHLALPPFPSSLSPPAIFRALPPDFRYPAPLDLICPARACLPILLVYHVQLVIVFHRNILHLQHRPQQRTSARERACQCERSSSIDCIVCSALIPLPFRCESYQYPAIDRASTPDTSCSCSRRCLFGLDCVA